MPVSRARIKMENNSTNESTLKRRMRSIGCLLVKWGTIVTFNDIETISSSTTLYNQLPRTKGCRLLQTSNYVLVKMVSLGTRHAKPLQDTGSQSAQQVHPRINGCMTVPQSQPGFRMRRSGTSGNSAIILLIGIKAQFSNSATRRSSLSTTLNQFVVIEQRVSAITLILHGQTSTRNHRPTHDPRGVTGAGSGLTPLRQSTPCRGDRHSWCGPAGSAGAVDPDLARSRSWASCAVTCTPWRSVLPASRVR